MHTPANGIPIPNKALYPFFTGSELNENLFINSNTAIGCTTNPIVDNSSLCASLLSFGGRATELSALPSGINRDFQSSEFASILNNQVDLLGFSILAGSSLNESLLTDPSLLGKISIPGCTTLNTTTAVGSSALCSSLLSLEEFKELGAMPSGVNIDFQPSILPATLNSQFDFSSLSLLSNAETSCTPATLLTNLPTLPLGVTPITSLCPDLLSLSQPTQGVSIPFPQKAVFGDSKLSVPHKPQQTAVAKTSKKKRNRQRCPVLLSFVKEWVNQGFYFGSFSKHMKEVYLFKARPKDDETCDDHHSCRRVYLTHRGGNKYTFHYSLMRPNGALVAQLTYALSSFQRIFAEVEQTLKK